VPKVALGAEEPCGPGLLAMLARSEIVESTSRNAYAKSKLLNRPKEPCGPGIVGLVPPQVVEKAASFVRGPLPRRRRRGGFVHDW
jgi:hypothetical protein